MIAEHKLTFDLLHDPGNEVAARFGLKFALPPELKKIYHEGFGLDLAAFNGEASWTLPMPGRFVAGTDGIVRQADADPDYTVRPEPEATLEAVRSLAGA